MRTMLMGSVALATMTATITLKCTTSSDDIGTPEVLQKRWLFTHPSHLEWWILPNLEKHRPKDFPITGVFCVHAENYPQDRYDEKRTESIRSRCRKLGLDFVDGTRHSHQSFDDFDLPLNSDWQAAMVAQLRGRVKRGESLALDCEPYYSANPGELRYHQFSDIVALTKACESWGELKGDIFIYPSIERHAHCAAIAKNTALAAISLDESTYNIADASSLANLQVAVDLGKRWEQSSGFAYSPGLYLKYLARPDVLEAVNDCDHVWFFARTGGHVDDLPNFGKPTWSPRK